MKLFPFFVAGRRKTAVANIELNNGYGEVTFNGALADYFFGTHPTRFWMMKAAQIRCRCRFPIQHSSINKHKLSWISNHPSLFDLGIQIVPLLALSRSSNMKLIIFGGGSQSQREALQLALSRVMIVNVILPTSYIRFRRHNLLTRNPREKESRKYGLKKARKAPQYSKRLWVV